MYFRPILLLLCTALITTSAFSEETPAPVCQPGTFVTATGCAPCHRLKFSTTTNARFCRRCPASQIASSDRTSCVPVRCRIGQYLPPGKVTCRICPENYYSTTTNATACTPCPPDKASLRGTTSPDGCIRCPIGRVVYRNYLFREIRCIRCTHYRSTFTVSAEKCVPCIPGTFRNEVNHFDGRCFPCHPGRFASSSGTRNCRKCDEGTYQPAQGATRCLLCPPSSFSTMSRLYCKPTCTLGSPGCVHCIAGQGYNNQTQRCERCPPGSISPIAVSTECIPCRGGSKPNATQRRCICTPGFTYNVASETCQKCPSGSSNTDGGKCNICFLEGASKVKCVCPPLTTKVNITCVPCIPTRYNRGSCRRCSTNEFIDEVRGTCGSCPPDTFSYSQDGTARECKPCAGDSKRSADERSCRCPESGQGVHDGKCKPCPAGTFLRIGSPGSTCLPLRQLSA